MYYVSIKVTDSVGLSERETNMLQMTILNFSALTSALIVGEGVAINPHEDGGIGFILVYAKALDKHKAEEMKESLEARFLNYFKMSSIELKAQIELY